MRGTKKTPEDGSYIDLVDHQESDHICSIVASTKDFTGSLLPWKVCLVPETSPGNPIAGHFLAGTLLRQDNWSPDNCSRVLLHAPRAGGLRLRARLCFSTQNVWEQKRKLLATRSPGRLVGRPLFSATRCHATNVRRRNGRRRNGRP